ncbi:MAG: GIY-YIG nuclease family protein [Candidatus Nezhaarchaeales archaeon]
MRWAMNGRDPGSDFHDVPRPVRALPPTGAYVLIILLKGRAKFKPGKLDETLLDEGIYAYVGSALAPALLPKRVARHVTKGKKLRWHIDYLLAIPEASVEAVVAVEARKRIECNIVSRLTQGGFKQAVAGFGSSDCSCPTHLLRSPLNDVEGSALLTHSLIESLGLAAKVAWIGSIGR